MQLVSHLRSGWIEDSQAAGAPAASVRLWPNTASTWCKNIVRTVSSGCSGE